MTKDIPLRVKAGAVGLDADEYRAQEVVPSGWTGMADVDSAGHARPRCTGGQLDRPGRVRTWPRPRELPTNTGLRLLGGDAAARWAGSPRTSRCGWSAATGRRSACTAARPSSAIALDLLLDSEVGIVSLGGRAGTGKSALALCAGLEAVMERRQHRKVVVFRPVYAVGGQELGYLPGSESEKMQPWAQAVFDTLGALVSQDVLTRSSTAACSRCSR